MVEGLRYGFDGVGAKNIIFIYFFDYLILTDVRTRAKAIAIS
jgi:hypothetical protein